MHFYILNLKYFQKPILRFYQYTPWSIWVLWYSQHWLKAKVFIKNIVKHHKAILKNCFFPKIWSDLHNNPYFTYSCGRNFFKEQMAAIYIFTSPIIKLHSDNQLDFFNCFYLIFDVLHYIDKASAEPVFLILIENLKDKS